MKAQLSGFKFSQTAWLFNLFIIALTAHELANLTWNGLLGKRILTMPFMTSTDHVTLTDTASVTTQHDWFKGLFGQTTTPVNTPVQSPVTTMNAPVNRMDLTLLGILAAEESDSGAARALIHSPKTGERSYGTGDLLGEMVVQNIHPDRVILDNQGQLETLHLPKKEGSATTIHKPPRNELPPETQALMGKLWNHFQENPESILENVRITPAFINGQFIGVELQPGKDQMFLEKFGVHAGDKVTWVNGIELTDPLKGMAVLGTLGTAQSLQFHVLRGSETLTFEFQRPP